jgi:hypothetical protein
MSDSTAFKHRAEVMRRRCTILGLVGLLCFAVAEAKLTIVTLAELVKKSDVVVIGHFPPHEGPDRGGSAIPFIPEATLKGTPQSKEAILFCNVHGDEYPDLSKMEGTRVIFALKTAHCLKLAHGNRSIVYVESGSAKTVLIEDEPEYQPLKEFLEKIRSLAAQ